MAELDKLAAELLELVQQPVNPCGQEITRQRWEIKVKAKLAEIFRLGMDAGWEKAHGKTAPYPCCEHCGHAELGEAPGHEYPCHAPDCRWKQIDA